MPWMKTPEALVPMALVPRGLPGPGGMLGGIVVAQEVPGFTQEGFLCLLVTLKVPLGVGHDGIPTATGYLFSISILL